MQKDITLSINFYIGHIVFYQRAGRNHNGSFEILMDECHISVLILPLNTSLLLFITYYERKLGAKHSNEVLNVTQLGAKKKSKHCPSRVFKVIQS